MEIVNKIWEYVSKEWRVIMQAKALFSAALLLAIIVIWAILNWYFVGIINDKEAEIQNVNTQNQMLQQQISDNLKPNTISNSQTPAPAGRILNDDQKSCLINELKDKTKEFTAIPAYYFAPDTDAQNYATAFQNIFMRVGITSGIGPVTLNDYSDTGLMIGTIDVKNPSGSAKDLKNILQKCGLFARFVKYTPGPNLFPQFSTVPFDIFVGPIQ
jgi:hypothetical protein